MYIESCKSLQDAGKIGSLPADEPSLYYQRLLAPMELYPERRKDMANLLQQLEAIFLEEGGLFTGRTLPRVAVALVAIAMRTLFSHRRHYVVVRMGVDAAKGTSMKASELIPTLANSMCVGPVGATDLFREGRRVLEELGKRLPWVECKPGGDIFPHVADILKHYGTLKIMDSVAKSSAVKTTTTSPSTMTSPQHDATKKTTLASIMLPPSFLRQRERERQRMERIQKVKEHLQAIRLSGGSHDEDLDEDLDEDDIFGGCRDHSDGVLEKAEGGMEWNDELFLIHRLLLNGISEQAIQDASNLRALQSIKLPPLAEDDDGNAFNEEDLDSMMMMSTYTSPSQSPPMVFQDHFKEYTQQQLQEQLRQQQQQQQQLDQFA